MTDYERDEPTRPCARGEDDMTPPLPMRAIERGAETAKIAYRDAEPWKAILLFFILSAIVADLVLRVLR